MNDGDQPNKIDLLEELRDCNEMIFDRNYNDEQRAALREMAKAGLVELAWVLRPEGKKSLEKKGSST